MTFLLIDFGASFVKTILYDKESDSFSNLKHIPSPFTNAQKLPRAEVLGVIKNILSQYNHVDGVVMCSILGGYYTGDIYYSWKYADKPPKPAEDSSLLSELFRGQPTYHVHANHSKDSNVTGLQLLGTLEGINFYSALGDTNCVIESVNLQQDELMINLGTGSQVIGRKSDNSYDITSFIPSGRAFNAYETFFRQFGVDLFREFGLLKMEDLEASTLQFDLNIFPQAYRYNGGGSVKNIQEDNLDKANFIASLFRSYIEQYIEIINRYKISTIYIAGGIGKKYPVIREFIQKRTNINTRVTSTEYEDTHLGMSNLIKRYL